MKQFLFTLTILFILTLNITNVKAQSLDYKILNQEHGLSTTFVHSMFVDSRGIKWIGTGKHGLLRFDGTKFKKVEENFGLDSYNITNIVEDNNGNLFLALQNFGFAIFDGEKVIKIIKSEKDSALRNLANEIENQDDASINIYTSDAIYNCDVKNNYSIKKVLDFNSKIKNQKFLYFRTPKNNVYIVKDEHVLKIEKNKISVFYNSINKGKISSVNKGLDGKIYVANLKSEIFEIIEKPTGVLEYKKLYSNLKTIDNKPFIPLQIHAYDSKNMVITGRDDAGILLIENSKINNLNTSKSFPSSNLNKIIEDVNGQLFFPTIGKGILNIPSTKFYNYRDLKETSFPNTFSIIKKNDKIVLADSKRGIFSFYEDSNGKLHKYKEFEYSNLDQKGFLTLFKNNADQVITLGNKLNIYDVENNSIKPIILKNLPKELKTITTAKQLKNGNYLLGHFTGIIIFDENFNFLEEIEYSNDSPLYYIDSVIEYNGRVILGGNTGIYELLTQDNKFKINKIADYHITAISQDFNNNLWFASNLDLISFDGTKFTEHSSYTSANTNDIYTIIPLKNSKLLVGSNTGVEILTVNSENKITDIKPYEYNTGFNGLETNGNSYIYDEFGNPYFNTSNGVYKFIDNHFNEQKTIYKPIITNVSIVDKNNDWKNNNKFIDNWHKIPHENYEFSPEENFIKFSFTSNYPANESKILYSYKLVGNDKHWTIPSNSNEITYNNLGFKKYTLLAKIINKNGIQIGEEFSYNFSIKAPIYFNWKFILPIIIFFLTSLIYIYKSTKNYDDELTKNYFEATNNLTEYSYYFLFLGFYIPAMYVIDYYFVSRNPDPFLFKFLIGILCIGIYILTKKNNYIKSNISIILSIFCIVYYTYSFSILFVRDINIVLICQLILSIFLCNNIFTKFKHYLIFIILNICLILVLYTLKPSAINDIYALFFCVIFLLLINYARRASLLNTKENFIFAYNIINSSNAIILAVNKNGEITFIGKSIEYITGFTSKELLKQNIDDYTDVKLLNATFDTNKAISEVSKFKTKQGNNKYIQWSIKQYSKNIVLFIGQDITTRIQIQEQYKNIVQFANDIICETDIYGNLVFVNKYAEKVLEYSNNELINKNFKSLVHPEYKYLIHNNFAKDRIKTLDEIQAIEFQIYTKYGNLIWVSLRARVKRDLDGNEIGFISIVRNITEEKRLAILEKEKNDYNKLLNTTINEISSFNFISYKNKTELVKKIAEKVLPVININKLSLWYKKSNYLELITLYDIDKNQSIKGLKINLEDTPQYINFLNENLYFVSDNDLNITREVSEKHGEFFDIKSFVDIPFYSKGEIDGLVSFETDKTNKIWTNEEITFCKNVVDVMLLGLANIKRHEAEKQTIYKSEILTAISKTTHQLLLSKNINEIFDNTFAYIGKAANADRAYFFRVDPYKQIMSQKFEWVNQGIKPVIDIEELQNLPRDLMPDLYDSLNSNTPYNYLIDEIPEESTREGLKQQDIKSLLILPIFVQNEFYGFIGFDDCTNYRQWSIDEINILNTFAGNIQATIERIINEKNIKESEEKFRLLANNIPAGVYLIDYQSKTNRLFLNTTINTITGYTYDEIANDKMGIYNLYHPDDVKRTKSKIEKAIKNREPFYNTCRIVKKNGEIVWIEEYGEGVYDNDELRFVQGVIIDITERRNAEEAIRAKEIAEASSKSKMEFLANMSHEIRTPLNGVIGFTDLLIKTPLNNIQEQYVKVINQSSKSLLEVVNDILDFSKIEAGKLEISILKTDLFQLIDQVTDMIKFSLHNKNLDFIINIDDQLPQFVWIDAMRIKQILVNLLSNAVKFTSEGYVEFGIELIEILNNKATLKFYVKDTGIGVKKENRDKIFEVFTQEDNSTTRIYGGTGLGLPISNKLLNIMGSKINVVDNQKATSGSEFSFILEVNSEKTLAENDYQIPKHIKNVLIIDTINKNSLNFNKSLKKQGINSVIFTEQDQIIYFKQNTHLIFIDYDVASGEIINEIMSWNLPIVTAINSTMTTNELTKYPNVIRKIKPLKTYHVKEYIKEALELNIQENEKPKINTNTETIEDKVKVLIVEDNKVNMLLTFTLVSKLLPNAKIIKAFNGQEGVDAYKQHKPDIILMDIQMPIKNGYDATEEIREIDKNTIIIALTAAIIKDEKDKDKLFNMNDYVSKPIDREELYNRLTYWLEQKRNTSLN